MDRLMRIAQDHGGTSTIVRKRIPSPHNPGYYQPRETGTEEDWGSACFAHLPAILKQAQHLGADGTFLNSAITEIIFLPSLREEFTSIEGTATLLEFYAGMLTFMDDDTDPSNILQEGWNFDLERSGQWNVAIGIMLRHSREYVSIPWTYCKLRKMGYGIGKALFMAHFVEYDPREDRWSHFNAPGGHTIICSRSTSFADYKGFINWRKQDTQASILKTAAYRGINSMFGCDRGYTPVDGALGISASLKDERLTESHIRSLGRKLKQRGKPYEVPNRKPGAVCGGVEPEARVDDGQVAVGYMPGSVIYGGIGCDPEPVLIEPPPLDDEFFTTGSGRARFIPGSD